MMEIIQWILLIGASFLPPLLYTIWIRNTERHHRQRWTSILMCFLWGASIAVLAAFILEVLLEIPLSLSLQDNNMIPFLIAVVIAPVVEEFTKPLALRLHSVKKEITELEDGLIYGAIAGLGFSATENLLYGYSFLSEGLLIFIVLITIRSFGGCLIHASATALTGYGYGKMLKKHTTFLRILPYFLCAIFVHGTFNFLVSYNEIGLFSGFFAAMGFAILMIIYVRKKIRTLDVQASGFPPH